MIFSNSYGAARGEGLPSSGNSVAGLTSPRGVANQYPALAGPQALPATAAAPFASGQKSLAVLLPCYNEEASVAAVIDGFRRALPHSTIYVYDNNSTDRTAAIAAAAGAIVRREPNQGKGCVVRRMFADIEADIYV